MARTSWFVAATIWRLPPDRAFEVLRQLADRRTVGDALSGSVPSLGSATVQEAKDLYLQTLCAMLGQFAVLTASDRTRFADFALQSARDQSSLDGLDPILATSLHWAATEGRNSTVDAAKSLWTDLGPPKYLGGGQNTTPFLTHPLIPYGCSTLRPCPASSIPL